MNTNSHGWWPNNIEFLTLIFSPSWQLLSSSSTRAHYVSKFNAKHTQKPHCWMGVEKELQIVASKPRAVSRNLKPICFQYNTFFYQKWTSLMLQGPLNCVSIAGRISPITKKWHQTQKLQLKHTSTRLVLLRWWRKCNLFTYRLY